MKPKIPTPTLDEALKFTEQYLEWWRTQPETNERSIAMGQHGHTKRRLQAIIKKQSIDLLDCPFCGCTPQFPFVYGGVDLVICSNGKCIMSSGGMTVEQWQTRYTNK
jgi:hypothetical protein